MKKLIGLFVLAAILAPFTGSVSAGVVALGILGVIVPKMSGVAFTTIPIQDARSVFTSTLVDVYKEKTTVMSFLRSFFVQETVKTKNVKVEVSRGTEKVAVDVSRYSNGNRNQASKSTERSITPPLYHEFISMNEHQLYDVVMGAIMSGNTTFVAEMTQDMIDKFMFIRDKIERSAELQCAQFLTDGIVQLNAYSDIDFKRKAASIVAYNAANDFSIGTVDPRKVIQSQIDFIRQTGKAQGQRFNVILGSEAYYALTSNTIIKGLGDIRSFDLMAVNTDQRNSVGGTPSGELTCGPYKVNLWTYTEGYEDANGDWVDYIDPKIVIVLPEKPRWKQVWAAVPQVIENGTVPQSGQYLILEEIDQVKGLHAMHVKAAPIVVPSAIDQVSTITVLN